MAAPLRLDIASDVVLEAGSFGSGCSPFVQATPRMLNPLLQRAVLHRAAMHRAVPWPAVQDAPPLPKAPELKVMPVQQQDVWVKVFGGGWGCLG